LSYRDIAILTHTQLAENDGELRIVTHLAFQIAKMAIAFGKTEKPHAIVYVSALKELPLEEMRCVEPRWKM
jgi:hypothetical protein